MARSEDAEIGAHLGEGREQAGAQRVHQDRAEGDVRARRDEGGDQREGGGGGVAGYFEGCGGERAPTAQTDKAAVRRLLDIEVAPEGAKNVFAMIARSEEHTSEIQSLM